MIRYIFRWVALPALLLLGVWTSAQNEPAGRVSLQVTETFGIRRFGYPVHARVPFPKGALKEAAPMRLARGDAAVPVQSGVASRWGTAPCSGSSWTSTSTWRRRRRRC